MQITLLPPLLPTEGPTAVPGAGLAFSPGMRVLATVLSTTADGGALLSLGGRQVPSGGPLPYPPGTTLHLEVVEGGPTPLLRLVSSEAGTAEGAAATSAAAAAALARLAREAAPAGPPVSPVTYGFAAAVLAARGGPDVRAAAQTLATWVPALVASGVLSPAQGEALTRALAPVPVPAPASASSETPLATQTVARAIAEKVADGGLLLERRLADVVRRPGPDAERAAASDVRARLAVLEHVLQQAPPALEGARTAVAELQDALLAEQARTAAHLARDGVVDVRVPLHVAGHDAEMRVRMRVARDAPDAGSESDPTPWRQVRLDLALDGLGRVQVLLGLVGMQVRTEFVVERADAADLIEGGLSQLGTALEAAGFAQVLSRVVVDPVRACAPDDLPDLPPQRAILDARA